MPEVFKYKVKNLPKVIYKKLGKSRAYAQFLPSENIIEIDPKYSGKKESELLLHEFLHWQYPTLSEEDVIKRSKELTEFLWKLKFRKVDI